ncbi:hypothetical protein Tco_0623935 [Tanacetum coccineum]|uniref:Uncharacterized protein n=1 Tax=Tanacetum coccineum TaxID=301880 RepID=A0ABQ4WCM2_9ASTR
MQLPLQRPRLQIMVISNGLKIWSLTQCGVKESARDVYYKRRIIAVTKLQIVEWHGYKHLDWITVHRDGKLTNLNVEDLLAFGVSLRMFTRSIVIQRRVEDLQLGVESYQKKLNITKPDTYRYDLKRRDAYTAYSNPRGFIYQNKDKKNKLMRIDELHKFSDGTIDDVWTALNDRDRQTAQVEEDNEKFGKIYWWETFDESNANVLERFYTSAGNPVKEILLKLNLPDHMSILTIHKDGGEVKEFQRSLRHFDTERLSRSDEMLKLKNFKKDGSLDLFKSANHERYEHVGPEVTSSQDGKVNKMVKRDYAWLMIS